MTTTGTYTLNWSGFTKPPIVIQPFDYNGPVHSTSEQPVTVNAATSIVLPGKHVGDYGERVNETIIRMLEHFAGPIPPSKPTDGQIWVSTGVSNRILDWDPVNRVAVLTDPMDGISAAVMCYRIGEQLSAVEVDLVQIGPTSVKVEGLISGTFSESWIVVLTQPKVLRYFGGRWEPIINLHVGADQPIHDRDAFWFNSTTETLNLMRNGDWTPVTPPALPLSGGQMSGDVEMGQHAIRFDGVVTDLNQLVPKRYVDDAIGAIPSGQQGDWLATSGGTLTGTLKIGTQTSTINLGIDVGRNPIINPLITWNPTDYVGAITTEQTYVPDKQYIARALAQHIADVAHGDSFLTVNQQGDAVAMGNLSFIGSKGVQFVGSSRFSISTDSDTLKITSSPNPSAVFEFRHGQLADTEPSNLTIEPESSSFGAPLYLLDGQPQPRFAGSRTDKNDDTLVATKGLVYHLVSQIPLPPQYVSSNGESSGTITFPQGTGVVLDGGSVSSNPTSNALELSGITELNLTVDESTIAITSEGVTINKPLYLLDNQPQPVYNGDVDDTNDDTVAASKGFVRQMVIDAPIIDGGLFEDSTKELKLYADTVLVAAVSLTHTHRGGDVLHQLGTDVKTNPNRNTTASGLLAVGINPVDGNVGATIPTSMMLELLDKGKAPHTNPLFNTPRTAPIKFAVIVEESDLPNDTLMVKGVVDVVAGDPIKLVRSETSGTLGDPTDPITVTDTLSDAVVADVSHEDVTVEEITYIPVPNDPDDPLSGVTLVPVVNEIIRPSTIITLEPGHQPIDVSPNLSWTVDAFQVNVTDLDAIPNVLSVKKIIAQGSTDWTTITVESQWTPLDVGLEYKRFQSVVELRGRVTSSTAATGDLIAVVPEGFRPSSTYTLKNGGGVTNAHDVVLNPNGELTVHWATGSVEEVEVHFMYFVD